jgi:antitoxin Phd
MKRVWQLQEAKSKLSQVLQEAIQHGPQIITKRGVEVAILLSCSEYRKMVASQKKLSAFFRDSPLASVDLDLDRDASDLREDIAP